MTHAPIALFCYRRLDVLIKTVEALKKNTESKDSLLFIFSDGFKNEEDKIGVERVREYIKTIDGFKEIQIIEAPQNKGLANSIIAGVTKIVNEYGKIIVVEDDILTSPYFLKYMNEALDMYKDDDNVASVTGYGYNLRNMPQSFFIKGAECWSWATWKRAWDIFEPNGQKLLDEIKNRGLEKEFDFDNSYPYVKMLEGQIQGQNDSWAIRWVASCFLKNKLCLYLGKPIVENIGFGVEGSVHCTAKPTKKDINKMSLKQIKLKKIKSIENLYCRNKFAEKFKISSGLKKGNFLLTKEKNGNKRIVTILGFIKISYKKKDKS